MLEQSKLAKLEIQGVATGKTLGELIALSSAIEGAIRILDARSKELKEQLDEHIKKMQEKKKTVFEDSNTDEEDEETTSSGGSSTEDSFTVYACASDGTNGFLFDKMLVSDTVSNLLNITLLDVSPSAEENSNYKLVLGVNNAADIGIVTTYEKEVVDEDGETTFVTALKVQNPEPGVMIWDEYGDIITTNDLSQYITINADQIFSDFSDGVIVKENGSITSKNTGIENYLTADLLLALQALSDILSGGYDGFLKVNQSQLEVVSYATCDEDAT